MTTTKSAFQRLLVPTFQTLELIDINDIIMIKAYENYSRLQLSNNRQITSTQSFGKYATMLEQSHFFQCHKSFVINLNHVVRYYKSGEVEMVEGVKIPVARRRKDEFIEAFGTHVYA